MTKWQFGPMGRQDEMQCAKRVAHRTRARRLRQFGAAIFAGAAALTISLETVQAQTLRDQLGRQTEPTVRRDSIVPGQDRSDMPPISVPQSSPTRAPAGSGNVTFVLNGLQVNGVSAYSQTEMGAIYGAMIGRQTTLEALYKVAAQIQSKYRKDGYFLSRVIVPEQRIVDGQFRIEVIEGYIADVELEGENHPSFRPAMAYMKRVTQERPIRLKTLEKYLLLTNDLPGIKATILLRRSPTEKGAAILVMRMERKGFGAFASIDNQGSIFTGRDTLVASAWTQSNTRFGERLSATIVSNNFVGRHGNRVASVNGSVALGSRGLRLHGLASYGVSEPGFTIATSDVRSTSILASYYLTQPVIRTRDLSLSVTGGIEMVSTNTDTGGVDLTRDRVRTLFLRTDTNWVDKWRGSGRANIELRRGLPILDASDDGDDAAGRTSRAGASGIYTTLRANIARTQTLTPKLSLHTEVATQFAFSRVLSSEEFVAGGGIFGRGYNAAELAGASGVGLSTELRYSSLAESISWLDAYQLFVFTDYAKSWDKNDTGDVLFSAGAGFRTTVMERVNLELIIAKPMSGRTIRGGNGVGGKGPQALVRASVRY